MFVEFLSGIKWNGLEFPGGVRKYARPTGPAPQGDHPHQLALALYIVQKEQEHHLHEHHRINGDLPVAPVLGGDFLPDKVEIQTRIEPAQNMVFGNPREDVDRLAPTTGFAWLGDPS